MKNNYCKIQNQNGFSLVELLVSIIVASIIILTAGGLSRISLSSFYKALNKQQIHNDLSYGLKLIRNRFRNAETSSVRINTSASNFWLDQKRLEIGNTAFGIYLTNNSRERKFVFLPDKSKEINPKDREEIAIIPDGDFTWTVTCDPSCPNPKALTVVFKRIKNNNPIPFHMETTIARRNP